MTKLTTTCFALTLSLLNFVCYAQKIKVKKLEKNVYIHVSYAKKGNTTVSTNGLILKTNKGVWIVDAASDDAQTKQVIAWVKKNLKKPIKQVIVTHSHGNKAGIKAFVDAKIPIISTKLTAKRIVKAGKPSPQPVVQKQHVIDCGNTQIEVFSPGWGHTPDNTLVYLSKQKVLYGGSFIQSTDRRKLVRSKESHFKFWKRGLIKVKNKFKKVSKVVPRHQSWGDAKLITHTMGLLDVSMKR